MNVKNAHDTFGLNFAIHSMLSCSHAGMCLHTVCMGYDYINMGALPLFWLMNVYIGDSTQNDQNMH